MNLADYKNIWVFIGWKRDRTPGSGKRRWKLAGKSCE